jgi:catechol 2,3-dioxygenase-like lactoylglutathione lyase family enzyme
MEIVRSCIPVIPSVDLPKSLRFWVEGLGFKVESDMRDRDRLVCCMLHGGSLRFMLNQRSGVPNSPGDYEGIRLYWAPANLVEARERLERLGYAVSEIVARDYGQSEFFMTDDDGFSHCFGVPTHA